MPISGNRRMELFGEVFCPASEMALAIENLGSLRMIVRFESLPGKS